MKKRLMSLLLAVIMILSIVPATAFAASTVTVNRTGITYYGYTGETLGCGSFDVNGTRAYCMQHENLSASTWTAELYTINADDVLPSGNHGQIIAKTIYYGYRGQGGQWSGFDGLTADQCNVIMSMTLSHFYNGTSLSGLPNKFQAFVDYIISKPAVPGNNSVTVARPSGGSDLQVIVLQKWILPANIRINKSSSNPSVTKGNTNYSLEGAKFGVYTSRSNAENDVGRVTTMTTDSNGKAMSQDLDPITYYVKELVAPKGYELNSTIYKVETTDGEVSALEVSEPPETGKLSVAKSSANTSITEGNACYSIVGAVYTIYKEKSCTNAVGTCTIKSDGTSNTLTDLPYQTYYAKETKAPKGMALDNTVYPIAINTMDATVLKVKDYPTSDPVGVLLEKVDAITGKSVPTGDGSLANAEYTFRYYDGQYSTAADAEASGAATRTWVFKTNDKGRISLLDSSLKISGDSLYFAANGNPTLPLGTVLIQETKAPKGYKLDDTVFVRNITPEGTLEIVHSYNAPTITETPVMGKIQIVKHTDHGMTRVETPEVGATFEVYLTSAGSYKAAPAESRDKLTIDKDGFAMTKDLPYGEYTVHQAGGWEGSKLMEDFTVNINKDGETYSYIINNERFYAYLKIVKIDSITKEAIPIENVGFQIFTPNNELVSFWGVDTWFSDAEGIVKIPAELEYGKGYKAVEVNAPEGYILADKPFMFNVVEEESMKEDDLTIIKLTAPNTPTSIQIDKLDPDGNPVIGAKLQVLNANDTVVDEWVSDGTGHIVYKLSIGSKYTLREIAAPEGKVLANDVIFTVENTKETQYVTMIDKAVNVEKLDPYGTPVVGATLQILDKGSKVVDEWISDGSAHTAIGLITGEKYTLHETAAPDGWLIADDVIFTVTDDGQNQAVSMENEEIPEIHTTATIEGSHVAMPAENVTLIDTVTYTKLVPGREYTVSGKLMDKTTGKALLDSEGKEIISTTVFTAKAAEGTVDVTFVFDASGLADHSTVVFEDLYRNGKLYCTHAEIEDEEQTVHFPEIGTTATVEDSHVAMPTENVTLIDAVAYKNLVPGKEYTVSGKLMDKANGKALLDSEGKEITSTTTFTAEAAEGTVDVTFVFNATGLKNNSTVVFEDMYDGEILVATHAKIDDEGQTVHFPEIGTTATVEGSHVAMAKKNVTLIDTVAYKNLVPGKQYTVSGKLMDKATGKALLVNGKEITSTAAFTAKVAEGTVDVTFVFDATSLQNNSTVVFEDLYDGEILVATHASIEDESQTVHFPEIGTTATVDGKHEVTAARRITLVDTVAYKNLVPGKQYTVSGKLMDKATGKALLIKGKEVTSTATFTAEAAEGTVDVTFKFNAIDLGGHDVVVFEDMYDGQVLVATHASIEDKGQTVTITPYTPDVPQTGDMSNTGFWIGIGGIALGGMIAAIIIFRKKKDDIE